MTTARIAFVEWPDGLQPRGPAWETVRRSVDAARPDILVTNEMPFGPWLAEHPGFDAYVAQRSIELHEQALDALGDLNAGAVLSSRPVGFNDRLINEASYWNQRPIVRYTTRSISRKTRDFSRKHGIRQVRADLSVCRLER
jgi:hypothetical protein